MPTFKSMTLAPGESGILPPGATVVSLSNPDIFSSENNCANKALETLSCYTFRFSGAISDGANRTENWDDDNFYVNGIIVSGVYYGFSSPFQAWQNASSFQTALDSIPSFNGLFTSITTNYDWDGANLLAPSSGWTNVVTLNTIPSIGNNLKFQVSTIVQNQTGAVPGGSLSAAQIIGELCPSDQQP